MNLLNKGGIQLKKKLIKLKVHTVSNKKGLKSNTLSFFCAARSLWACPHVLQRTRSIWSHYQGLPCTMTVPFPAECMCWRRLVGIHTAGPLGAPLLYEWVSFTLTGRYQIRTSSQGHVSLHKKLPADHDFANSPGQSTRFRTGLEGNSQMKHRDLNWSELVQ